MEKVKYFKSIYPEVKDAVLKSTPLNGLGEIDSAFRPNPEYIYNFWHRRDLEKLPLFIIIGWGFDIKMQGKFINKICNTFRN